MQLRSSTVKPVDTKGNWFMKGKERFLIKGISYYPRIPGGSSYGETSKIDPLDDVRLEEIKRDISVFKELGLNTIQISKLEPGEDYSETMKLLADAGIYVLVNLLDEVKGPRNGPHDVAPIDPNMDTSEYYTPELMKPTLKVVDEMAKYLNTLGFVVTAEAITMNAVSKLAEVYRAAVRDIKFFLRQREGRAPPVGVSINEILTLKEPMIQYMTAGSQEGRVDFFAFDCWSWAYKSSFQISGWKNMVAHLGQYPVPMYFSAFGPNVGKPRLWEEIECLFSPDMTGTISGGCLYTYYETGNRYGIVQAGTDTVQRKEEFSRLKKHYDVVNARNKDQLYVGEPKEYESWSGDFPQGTQMFPWNATPNLPQIYSGLQGLIQEVNEEREDAGVTEDVQNTEIEGR